MFRSAKCALSIAALAGMPFIAHGNETIDPPRPPVISDTVPYSLSLTVPTMSLMSESGQEVVKQSQVHQAGAEFIKVHFKRFQIPEGAFVEVSNPENSETYRYEGNNHSQATFDPVAGEDGVTRFSAMSITGDTAVIRLVIPAGVTWTADHGVEIDRYYAGHPEAVQPNNISENTMFNTAIPESTCGVNERRDVACWESSHPVEFERTRPVARLLMDGSGLCTGWRVGSDNHMFTNNHCLDNESRLQNTEVWFNYQKTDCNGSTYAGTVKVTGAQMLKTDYTLDYTLFTVNNFEQIAQFGYFGLDVRTPTKNEYIYIPQHGAGNPKELSIESDQNSGGLCQIDVAVANGRGTGTDTGYFCDTIGGSSGSPVLAASSNNVIALHHFGGCENQGVRIDKIWPQVSSFFNNTPPVGDNNIPGNKPPVAQIAANCDGLNCTFNGSGSTDVDGSIVDYVWAFGDGNQANGASVTHSFASNGSYQVTLTVTDDGGLSSTKTQDVIVNDGSGNQLTSGVPVAGLSGVKGSEQVFVIDVPKDQNLLTVTTSGGTGDVDLYIKAGAVPTTNSYDCRPYKSGNAESCTGTYQGKVYVKLVGYSAFSDVTLVATTKENTNNTGFPVTDITATQGNWQHYSYTVPAGVTSVNVAMSGGTGDADLYVRKGQAPTKTSYDCRPYKSGNTESCAITAVEGEQIHIGILAFRNFSGVMLDVK